MSTDIYAIPDLTKKVRQRDGDRGERRDSEDRGQMEEMVVDIYESVDFIRRSDVVSGPQEDVRDNATGSHTRGQRSKTVISSLRAVAVCLGMLCLILMGVIVVLVMYYHLANDQKNYNDRIWEEDLLKTNLTLEKDHLEARYKNMILEKDRLETRYEKMKLKKETEVTPCSSGWKKFGCSFYCRSAGWKTWDESRDQCRKTGADLVVINSKEEQEFIGGLTRGRGSWIGLKRTNDKWTWVDGTALTTQYWASGKPVNFLKWDCAYLHEDGGWHNQPCSNTQNPNTLICEK